MSPKATWVFMGPEPHLAHCERCGETIDKPELPISFDAFIAFVKYVTLLHADCPEPAS